MSLDLSSYKVATNETSSSVKFDNLVQAVQDYINGLGTLAIAPSQITGYPSDATKYLDGSGAWSAPGLLANRVVAGRVSAGGSVDAGSGFSVNRTGTGRYTITFSTAFSSAPFVCANLRDASPPRNIYTTSFSNTNFTVAINKNSDDTAVDVAFGFIALLP